MSAVKALPCRGDFITLESPREKSAVAICVGHSRAGALRVRRYILRPDWRAERRRNPSHFEKIITYRGAWRSLPVTDPRHPAFDPCAHATLAELGL